MVLNVVPAKEKRRASEKRKEKSRDAARCRRSRESEIFSDLAAVLPLPTSIVNHLDKASIMRLIITHLRIMKIFKKIEEKRELKHDPHDNLYLKAIGGFVLVLALDGDIIFSSNNVSTYLGISQVDLLGQSIYEVTHPCDHNEIKDVLAVKNDQNNAQISFFVRMKCTLSSKGRSINIKSASYKVLRLSGCFMELDGALNDKFSFVSVATPIPHPIDIDAPLGAFIFLSKHSLDMKFTYADERMADFLGYNPENLIGKSMYQYHHVQDNGCIEKAFKSLFARGQSETGMYRFLAQGGGYVWVSTQATVIYCDKGTKPQSVVCVNYVISEKLNENDVYSSDQLEWVEKNKEKNNKPVSVTSKLLTSAVKVEQLPSPRPQPATSKIFAPKTADMNKGFLTFADDETGYTIMKDEPEDLTHLAPTAGDVCVPLDMPLYDVFNNISFSPDDNYCPLINTDAETPLFSSFRDDCSNTSLSPDHSDSPGHCSMPSLCSLTVDSPQFEDSSMKSLLGLDLVDSDSDDLSGKAPYISMSEGEDIPSLMPFDLVWNVNFTSSSNNSSSRCSPVPPELSSDSNISSLQQLLENDDISLKNHISPVQPEFFITKTANLNEPETRKRASPLEQENVKKRKHQTLLDTEVDGNCDSVLRNLLVIGHDINAGYICTGRKGTVSVQNKDA